MLKIKILKEIFSTLKELIRLYKILIARKKATTLINKDIIRMRIKTVCYDEWTDADLAETVAYCESSLNPRAMRMNDNGSIDRGLFQWNDYWHPEISNKCAFDIECSTRAFCTAVKQGNLRWWNSSKHCWGK